MKYMLLIYGNEELWDSFPPEEFEPVIRETERPAGRAARSRASSSAPRASATRCMAKTVHLDDGVPVVTDGPYIEAKEYLGSFDIIDVESEERALEIAARVPFARIGQVEVRPLMHEAAEDV